LKLQSAQAADAVTKQQETVAQLKRDYDIALENPAWTPEKLQDCRSALVIAQDRLAVARQNEIAKRELLDAELGRVAQQDELATLERQFTQAGDRLSEARATIETLKTLNRELPNRMADAEREFRIALQSWTECRTRRDAAKSRRPSNGVH
jgi:chromosome segregation ATPase